MVKRARYMAPKLVHVESMTLGSRNQKYLWKQDRGSCNHLGYLFSDLTTLQVSRIWAPEPFVCRKGAIDKGSLETRERRGQHIGNMRTNDCEIRNSFMCDLFIYFYLFKELTLLISNLLYKFYSQLSFFINDYVKIKFRMKSTSIKKIKHLASSIIQI